MGRSLPMISWKPFDEACTPRKKKEQEIRRKKNVGLSEMHNIFVAADEEKREKFMKKQINNPKRKKNENSKVVVQFHALKILCHSDSYVSFPITFSGIFHWAGVYQ